MSEKSDHRILLTGATGYVGRRLLPLLQQQDRTVRCLARKPERLRSSVDGRTEVISGDLLDLDSLRAAMRGIELAFYLVHSMDERGDFEKADRQAAENFARAAREANLRRIIYLGALGDDNESLSPHLRSRREVADILRGSGVPVIEFRSSIIIGRGSLSFELVSSLVERLPVMVCPRWVRTPTQPIAIDDVLSYLLAAIDLPDDKSHENRVFEIGGPDVVSYGQIMQAYARERGLHRLMIPVPVLTPWLSSLWLALVTPLLARVGRKLLEGVRNPTVVRNPAALDVFAIRPISLDEAMARATAGRRLPGITTSRNFHGTT